MQKEGEGGGGGEQMERGDGERKTEEECLNMADILRHLILLHGASSDLHLSLHDNRVPCW